MKRTLVALLTCLGLVAGAAVSGTFTVSSTNPLDSVSIVLDIVNNDGFDLLKVTFDTYGAVISGLAGLTTTPVGDVMGVLSSSTTS